MQKLPPLRSLQAFEAVARHRSFKAAAAELNVTPTAISHQIRALEQACGKPLLRRRPRPLRLTPEGELLYPALRSGFELFANAIAAIDQRPALQPLRVTSPNAFASRWLVPRLPQWYMAHADCPLEVIGTDHILDLAGGEADVAIRYARTAPREVAAVEIARDAFFPVASPALLGTLTQEDLAPEALLRFPLIHYEWTSGDLQAPSWPRWFAAVGATAPGGLAPSGRHNLTFREELHAIDAVVASQGIALCSDIVVGDLLRDGTLRKAHEFALPGYGFYIVHAGRHDKSSAILAFRNWLMSCAPATPS